MKLLVLDASALVEFLLGTPRGRAMHPSLSSPEVDLHVPALCDVEVASAFRSLVRWGRVEVRRADAALRDYSDLPLTRHEHLTLLDRIFELRDNFSCYDAAYVALAEVLDAAFRSGDERLIGAVRTHTDVRLEDLKWSASSTRPDGGEFAIRPVSSDTSPLDVPGIDTGVSAEDILEAIRESRERGAE